MKKRNLLIIIVGLIIASLVITLVILNNKNKDKDKTPTDKNLISINAPEGINIETTFIEGNKYIVINLINNTKEIIKSSTLKVTFSTKEEIKEVDLIPVGNKSIIKIFIPEELRKNILKEKIKINYEIKENTNVLGSFTSILNLLLFFISLISKSVVPTILLLSYKITYPFNKVISLPIVFSSSIFTNISPSLTSILGIGLDSLETSKNFISLVFSFIS